MLHLVLSLLPVLLYAALLLFQAWRFDRRRKQAFAAGYAVGRNEAQNSAPVIFSLN